MNLVNFREESIVMTASALSLCNVVRGALETLRAVCAVFACSWRDLSPVAGSWSLESGSGVELHVGAYWVAVNTSRH